MLSRNKALNLLHEVNTPPEVISHSETVAREAIKIAKKLQAAHHEVDLQLLEAGALLHDIGRSQSHNPDHGVIGGIILRGKGFEKLALIAERHIGAGITKQEARKLGLPEKRFIPETLEEKIVAEADNRAHGDEIIPFKDQLVNVKRKLGVDDDHPVIQRMRDLHEEILRMSADE